MAVYFNFRFDIGIWNLKQKFREIFLFSLFDASITRKSVYSKVIFLIASDWCSLIIVTNVVFAFGS